MTWHCRVPCTTVVAAEWGCKWKDTEEFGNDAQYARYSKHASKCRYNVTFTRVRIFASWTLLRRSCHLIHSGHTLCTCSQFCTRCIVLLLSLCSFIIAELIHLYIYPDFIKFIRHTQYTIFIPTKYFVIAGLKL